MLTRSFRTVRRLHWQYALCTAKIFQPIAPLKQLVAIQFAYPQYSTSTHAATSNTTSAKAVAPSSASLIESLVPSDEEYVRYYEEVMKNLHTFDGEEALEFIGGGTQFLQSLFQKQSPLGASFHVQMKTALEKLAVMKNMDALIALARMYSEGTGGFVKDVEVTFKYYLQAAEMGHVQAQFMIGLFYLKGLDILLLNDLVAGLAQPDLEPSAHPWENVQVDEKTGASVLIDDKAKKRQMLKEKADNDSKHQVPKGPRHPPGVSSANAMQKVKENRQLAVYWIEKAAEGNHPRAQLMLSHLQQNETTESQNAKQSFELLVSSAKQNDLKALYALATNFWNGIHPTPITEEAVRNQYSFDSHPDHFFHLTPDPEMAISLFKRAAELGSPEALFWLGHAYHRGTHVPQDINFSLDLLQKAAQLNYSEAVYYMALMYRTGDGVPVDLTKWKQLFERSVQLKHAAALFALADMHYHGREGYPSDWKKAFNLYQEAAQLGDDSAWYCLGAMFYKGRGVEKNLRAAYDCYSRAAMLGNTSAIAPLANMSFKGEGVPRDEKYAQHLFSVLKQMAATAQEKKE